MGLECRFKLNGKPVSHLVCKSLGLNMPAFSGQRSCVNDPETTFVESVGPIPLGLYYIVDRPKGGGMQKYKDVVYDWASDTRHADWFGLFKEDGLVDDYTQTKGTYGRWKEGTNLIHYVGPEFGGHVEKVVNPRRGNFRLHPVGYFGISEGCITLFQKEQFYQLREHLVRQPYEVIPATQIRTYGAVIVER